MGPQSNGMTPNFLGTDSLNVVPAVIKSFLHAKSSESKRNCYLETVKNLLSLLFDKSINTIHLVVICLFNMMITDLQIEINRFKNENVSLEILPLQSLLLFIFGLSSILMLYIFL